MARRLLFVLSLIVATPPAPNVFAQQISPVGAEGRLTIATWNIEWFGHEEGPSDLERQFNYVRAVIEQSGVDIWSVQEIANPAQFNRLLDSLGGDFNGLIRNNCTDFVQQRVGYIFRREVISVTNVQQLFRESPNHCFEFAQRPPLRLDTRVTMPDTTVSIVFIGLHMKARGDHESYQRRVAASGILKNYVDDQRVAGLLRHPVVILGDYNDFLLRTTRGGANPSPYANFMQDSQRYYPVTRQMEQQGKHTFCGNVSCTAGNSTIDHIMITQDLFPHYELDSGNHYIELATDLPSYRSTTSDHLPVYARFEFRTATSVEEQAERPVAASITSTYPNPFADVATLTYELPRASDVRIEVFDGLGRRVKSVENRWHALGSYQAEFDGSDLPAGVYLLRLVADGVIETVRMMKAQ